MHVRFAFRAQKILLRHLSDQGNKRGLAFRPGG
ncbi:MAG: hypothetical protein JWP94_3423 [Mucilaginibacter sp.]|nr:hypothetical protein [Mucilaginibacter sp.]